MSSLRSCMHLAASKLNRRWRRWTAGPAAGLILLYHRVADLESDPQQLNVPPQVFTEHLEVLRRWGQARELDSLYSDDGRQRGQQPFYCVTFDDGYADNYEHALPLLERFEIPATVFVSTGYTGGDREFWWDELERLILLSPTLRGPCPVELPEAERAAGNPRDWSGPPAGDVAGWSVLHKYDPSPRHRLYRILSDRLRRLSVASRENALEALRRWSGQEAVGRSTHRAMDRDQVRRMDAGGLVRIGAHTVHHPSLAALDRTEQWDEMKGSRDALQQWLGRSITSFSFPFGTRHDYNATSLAICKELQFDVVCTNEQGAVRRHDSPHQLTRRLVRNWSGAELKARLTKWLRR